jgi:Putative methyltransferase
MTKDWVDWHRSYDEQGSPLQQRLAVVQLHIQQALDNAPAGPIRVVSVCAGQGRDLLGVLTNHRRGGDVTARLVELDGRNADQARAIVTSAQLSGVEVVQGDASCTSAYEGAVPADLVLVCGVFGNISDEDIHATITHLPSLCAPRATVIWTRYPRDPQLLPSIDRWFCELGFERLMLTIGEDDRRFGVGVHRLVTAPHRYRSGVRLFSFVDDPDPAGRRRPAGASPTSL